MITILRLVSALALLVASGCNKDNAGEPAENAAKPAVAVQAPAPTAVAKAEAAPSAGAADCAGTMTAADGEQASDCGDAKNALGCNQWDAEAATVLGKEIPSDAAWKAYAVTGMKCGGCERRVIAKLGAVDGVVGVEADAELGQVRVATKPDAPEAVANARTALDGLYKISKDI